MSLSFPSLQQSGQMRNVAFLNQLNQFVQNQNEMRSRPIPTTSTPLYNNVSSNLASLPYVVSINPNRQNLNPDQSLGTNNINNINTNADLVSTLLNLYHTNNINNTNNTNNISLLPTFNIANNMNQPIPLTSNVNQYNPYTIINIPYSTNIPIQSQLIANKQRTNPYIILPDDINKMNHKTDLEHINITDQQQEYQVNNTYNITIYGNNEEDIKPVPSDYIYNSTGNVIGLMDENKNIINIKGIKYNKIKKESVNNNNNINNNNNHILSLPPISLIDDDRDKNIIMQSQQIDPNIINTTNNIISELNQSQSNNVHNHNPDESEPDKQSKTITPSTMKRGRHISDDEKPFHCKECNKKYKYLCNYRSHCRIHTDDAFVCSFCKKRFGRKSNYQEHLRIHTGESPYTCSYCKKSFKQHHGWKDHLRVHTGEKPYMCKICGKRFTVGHNLNAHMRIHTGERPYICPVCSKSYRQKSAFNSHIKNIHGPKVWKSVKGGKNNKNNNK